MSILRCNSQGCQRDLWYRDNQHQEVLAGNSTCMTCRQVVLCLDHFQRLWSSRQGKCPHCNGERWSVKILPQTPFSPQIQADVLRRGGQFSMVDSSTTMPAQRTHSSNGQATPVPQRAVSQRASGSSGALTYERPRRAITGHRVPLPHSQKSSDDMALVNFYEERVPSQHSPPSQVEPQAPVASRHVAARKAYASRIQNDRPQPPTPGFDAYADEVTPHQHAYANGSSSAIDEFEERIPPRSWRLISRSDLPQGARGIGGGIALCRENDLRLLMMDDDRIIRHIEVEGEILAIAQSPRKRRLIAERIRAGAREMVWLKGKEIQGFITNALDDEGEVFGAHFVNDHSFVYFIERPDHRIDMREGRFMKARGVQSRSVGSSLRGAPLAPVSCHQAQRVFFFKQVTDEGYIPICRQISDGDDLVMGELCDEPVVLSASRNAGVVSWIDTQGKVWASSKRFPTSCIGRSDLKLLSTAHDGGHVAWMNRGELKTFSLNQNRKETWNAPTDLLAIGWRSEVI